MIEHAFHRLVEVIVIIINQVKSFFFTSFLTTKKKMPIFLLAQTSKEIRENSICSLGGFKGIVVTGTFVAGMNKSFTGTNVR